MKNLLKIMAFTLCFALFPACAAEPSSSGTSSAASSQTSSAVADYEYTGAPMIGDDYESTADWGGDILYLRFKLFYDKETDEYEFAPEGLLDWIKSCSIKKDSLTVVLNEGYPVEYGYARSIRIYLYTDLSRGYAASECSYYGTLDRDAEWLRKNSDGDTCVFFNLDRDYAPGEILAISVDTDMNE